MIVYLVHRGDAVGPEVDPRRRLSERGREHVVRLAAEAAARGAHPAVVWHSGKLRARQTAYAFWRACNALAPFSATRDLEPEDPPEWIRDRLRGETRDILIAGHYPHLPRLLTLMLSAAEGADVRSFPQHGVVAVQTEDEGKSWKELWRLEPGAPPATPGPGRGTRARFVPSREAGKTESLSRRGGRIGTGGVTELHRAAWAGEVEEVRRRLAAGDAVDSADAAGFTPLGAAAAAGRAGAMAELLAAGADPNRPALDRCTPLLAAVGGGHPEIVRALLAAGADGNAIVDYRHTAVRRAAWRVDWPTLSVLLEGGVQLGLFDAALYVLRGLLAAGAQVVLAESGSSTVSRYHDDDPPHIKPDVFAVTGALALPADTPPQVRGSVRVEKDLLAFDDYVHFVGPRTQVAGGLRGCFLESVEWPAYAERLSALLARPPAGTKRTRRPHAMGG